MLVDSHCHLNLCQDPAQVIQRAKAAGVEHMQTIATDLAQVEGLLAIAEQNEGIFVSAGVHPCSVKEKKDIVKVEELLELAKHPKLIGLGETGLDYYHPDYNKLFQQESFINHIYASQEIKLPVIVHNRNSDQDCAHILTSQYKTKAFPGVIHCFASDINFAKTALDIGFYISISGIVTFKNATNLTDVVKYVPLNMLLIETDSPYLAPEPMRGKTNEPAFVKFVAQQIAKIKGIEFHEAAKQTTDNFFNLFNKASKREQN
jgi:TatD DNase family protein